jgi:hypothetical protein
MTDRSRRTVDGIEVEAPVGMSDEEIRQRRREMREANERTRAEVSENLDLSAARRAILDDMRNSSTPWAPEMLAFVEATNDAQDIAALHRAMGEPLTDEEFLQLMQRHMEKQQD